MHREGCYRTWTFNGQGHRSFGAFTGFLFTLLPGRSGHVGATHSGELNAVMLALNANGNRTGTERIRPADSPGEVCAGGSLEKRGERDLRLSRARKDQESVSGHVRWRCMRLLSLPPEARVWRIIMNAVRPSVDTMIVYYTNHCHYLTAVLRFSSIAHFHYRPAVLRFTGEYACFTISTPHYFSAVWRFRESRYLIYTSVAPHVAPNPTAATGWNEVLPAKPGVGLRR